MNHVPPVQEPDLRHARCKPRLLAQARPARRGCLASLCELGAETRPHVTASQPAAGRVASKCSTRRQPHVDGCFGSHTCGCSRSAPISITCSSLEPGRRWQQQEDIRFLLPILETGVTIATHFELWPVCSGLLHDLYLQVGPASQILSRALRRSRASLPRDDLTAFKSPQGPGTAQRGSSSPGLCL